MKKKKSRHLTLCLFLFGPLLPVQTQAPASLQGLAGLWGCERTFGPAVGGELTIDGRSEPWLAQIGGYQLTLRREGTRVSFVLPGDQGEFRGRLDSPSNSISGHWIQPPGQANSSRYATPVLLKASARKVWRGEVVPLPDRLSLYLVMTVEQDGQAAAFIRNPEFNLGMGHSYAVTRNGSHLLFTGKKDRTDRLEATYTKASDTLSVRLPGFAAPFILSRRGPSTALGFYPRTPPVKAYRYHPPIACGDGWPTASLQAVGMSPAPIFKLVQRILDTGTTGYTTPYIQSLLIARHGRLALEEYFYGFGPSRTHDTRSAGKTLASILMGIAMRQGAHLTPRTPVYKLFAEYRSFKNPDPRKKEITVEDLLTMRSGLACDDNDRQSPGDENNMQSQSGQPDWYKYTLDLPMSRDPGVGRAVYCSAGINLVGGVLRNATGTWLPEFFERHLAQPLGIRSYHVNLTPEGDAYLGGGIYLRPRDLLKLGQLYLDGGVWKGQRIVSREWIQESTRLHSRFSSDHGYGYAWHLRGFKVAGHEYREYAAEGNGGQFLIVIPKLDMVIAINAGNYGNFPTWIQFSSKLVPEYIATAALSK